MVFGEACGGASDFGDDLWRFWDGYNVVVGDKFGYMLNDFGWLVGSLLITFGVISKRCRKFNVYFRGLIHAHVPFILVQNRHL